MAFTLDMWWPVVLLLAPVLAEYAKVRVKAEKAFNWIVVSAIFFLLALGFEVPFWSMVSGQVVYASYLFQFLGWLALLIGALWVAVTMMKK